MSTSTSAETQVAGKYLTVVLAGDAYGIAALKVREIIRLQKITPVPQLPSHIRGVINLRGRVIPVVDLRTKFGLTASDTARTCIVVVHINATAARVLQIGLIVDAVEEVATIAEAEIEPVPNFGLRVDTRYLLGVAKIQEQVKMLLNIDRVLAGDDISAAV